MWYSAVLTYSIRCPSSSFSPAASLLLFSSPLLAAAFLHLPCRCFYLSLVFAALEKTAYIQGGCSTSAGSHSDPTRRAARTYKTVCTCRFKSSGGTSVSWKGSETGANSASSTFSRRDSWTAEGYGGDSAGLLTGSWTVNKHIFWRWCRRAALWNKNGRCRANSQLLGRCGKHKHTDNSYIWQYNKMNAAISTD